MKRRKTIVLYAVMFLLLFTAGWAAADENVIDLAALPAQTSELRITSDCVLTGTLNSSCPIVVDADVTVTLRNVTINRGESELAGIDCQKGATIIVEEKSDNSITGGNRSPGIFIRKDCTLTIQGAGKLKAAGGYGGAGIGSGTKTDYDDAGNIEIKGGELTTNGGAGAAGIGSGGHDTSCGNLTILKGTIHSTGGKGGAGIGAGTSTCGEITIVGGEVEATGGMNGAGIGSGSCANMDTTERSDSKCENIIIQGGTVIAVGKNGGAGIGTGGNIDVNPTNFLSCRSINISGGRIIAKAGDSDHVDSVGCGYSGRVLDSVTIGTETGSQSSKEYTFQGKSISFVITAPAAVENLIYNGEEQVLTTAESAEGGDIHFLVNAEDTLPEQAEFRSELPEGKEAGTWYVWYKVVGDNDHTDTEPVSIPISVNIAEKQATITAKDQTIRVGNNITTGTDQVTADGLIAGHSLQAVTLTATDENTIRPSAVTILDNAGNDVTSNYEITYTDGVLTQRTSVSYTIRFRVVNGFWNDDSKGDDTEKEVILTGYAGEELRLTAEQIPDAGDKPAEAYRAGEWNTEPNTETVITGDTTYTYTYAEKLAPHVTVPITAELTYNGSEQELVTGGSTTHGTLMYALTTDQTSPAEDQYSTSVPTRKDAGSWIVWYYVQGNQDYLSTEPSSISTAINKKAVTVSGIEADNKIYDKTTTANLGYSHVAFEEKINGDKLSVTATGTFENSNAGTGKTVNISGLTLEGDSAGNYMLAAQGQQTTTTANITQKEISLTWGDTTFTYDNESHCPTVTARGIIDDDEVQIKVTGTQTNAGTYTATASGLTGKDAGNYRMPNNNTTQFTISPADGSALNVIVTPYNAMYDGYAHGIAVSVSEIEGVTVRYGTKTGEYQLDSSPEYTDAGTYTVYYRIEATNYTPRIGSAEIKIQKKPVTVTAKDQTIQEGGSIGSGTEQANLIDALAGHALASVNLAEENGNIIASSANIYDRENRDVTDNYTITYESGKLTVIPEIDPADRAAADAVMQKIRAIGIVTYTDACAEKIEEARDAYNQLTDAQKALVDNAETLTIAERAFQELQKSFGLYHLDQTEGIVYEEDNDQNAVLRIWRSIRDGQTFDLFRYVQVDGYTLAKDVQYETAAGSIIITFKASYLNTLRPGEHPVTVGFSDGTIQTTLTIRDMTQEEAEPPPEDEAGIQTENGTPTETGKREKSGENETPTEEVQDIPKTGDAAHPALWMMITLLGACILCNILYKARRSE